MNNDANTQTKKLTSSGEIKINELLSFLQQKTANEWITLVVDLLGVANTTITDVGKKRDIIKASGKADTIAEGLRLQKDSILKIWDASLTQFPSIVKSMFGLSGGSGKSKGKSGKGKGKAGKSGKSGKSGTSSAPMINLGDPALREKIGSSVGDLFDQTIEFLKGTKESIEIPGLSAAAAALAKGKGTGAPKGKAAAPKGKAAAPKAKATPKGKATPPPMDMDMDMGMD